jgi:seryl-tRNA synthetase
MVDRILLPEAVFFQMDIRSCPDRKFCKDAFMIDIRLIRENPQPVRDLLARRAGDHAALIDEVLACDAARRGAETTRGQLQASRKSLAKRIGALKAAGGDSSAIEEEARALNAQIAALEAEAASAAERQNLLLMEIPNLPHTSCPVGADASANPVVGCFGEKPVIENPKDHVALADGLGLLGWEDAIRVSGSGFAVYRGAGARLQRCLINFLLDLQTQRNGYEEAGVPCLVRRACMEGTGQLPKFESDMYGTEPDPADGRNALFLAPTAEVPLTNLYRDTLLEAADLPVAIAACTPCFRREAGSAGRTTKGIIRMHQFDKVEIVRIVHPDDGLPSLDLLTAHARSALQLLGLHHRIIELCTGDLGQSAAKTYDIEVWAPGQNAYLEVSSCSWFSDYQARRMKLRFKDHDGKNRFPHTLNGSGTALPRLFVALLEQCQQPDGSILLPEPLRQPFGSDRISPR